MMILVIVIKHNTSSTYIIVVIIGSGGDPEEHQRSDDPQETLEPAAALATTQTGSVYMYIYIYIYMYTYLFTYIYIYIYTSITYNCILYTTYDDVYITKRLSSQRRPWLPSSDSEPPKRVVSGRVVSSRDARFALRVKRHSLHRASVG